MNASKKRKGVAVGRGRVSLPTQTYFRSSLPSTRILFGWSAWVVFAPFRTENGNRLCRFWFGIGCSCHSFRENCGSVVWTYSLFKFQRLRIKTNRSENRYGFLRQGKKTGVGNASFLVWNRGTIRRIWCYTPRGVAARGGGVVKRSDERKYICVLSLG